MDRVPDIDGGFKYRPYEGYIIWDNSRIIVQPTNTDNTTRLAALTQALNDYNANHPYQDSDTIVNYYIGTTDEDGNVTDYYDPSLYDEETLIFTEPVTGAQYQTTGWTYDYTTRSYDITLDAGTFTIDGTDISRIYLVYGDDAVGITYYDSSGLIVAHDTYNYVAVATNACALNGHTYTVETTKEATCYGSGERIYTCSVCGNQYVEEIAMLEHTPVYSEYKEATCTTSGVAMYTCSRCGSEYTEAINPLGHDWVSTEIVATTYTFPKGVKCACGATTNFVSTLDETTGVYETRCLTCDNIFYVDAVVNTGYTTYTCSRCGVTKTEYEDEDHTGLFESVGNFIADGITWCTEKLTQLVDNLTGMIDSWSEYMSSMSEQGGQVPGFLGALFGLIPEDLMNVVWFSLIGLVILAVWKKWLS